MRGQVRISAPFRQLLSLLTTHRQLTWEVTKRELTARYSGQLFGAFWVFVHPLFLIGLYVFVFAVVLDLKIGAGGRGDHLTVYILAGLVPWMACQESMVRACSALVGNASLVKQIVFPVEVLPLTTCMPAAVNQAIASALGLVCLLTAGHLPPATLALVPLLWCAQLLGMLGISYGLAILTVFVRDTKDVVQLFAVAGVYLVPVFYEPDWVPAPFRPMLAVNPFSHMVWCYQDAIYFGRLAHPVSWVVFPAFCLTAFVAGSSLFRSLKPMSGSLL